MSEHCTYSSAAATLRDFSRDEREHSSNNSGVYGCSEESRREDNNVTIQVSHLIETESELVSRDDKVEPVMPEPLVRRYKTEHKEE